MDPGRGDEALRFVRPRRASMPPFVVHCLSVSLCISAFVLRCAGDAER